MTMLTCGRFVLDMQRPRIMAIINTTPDSFSGDGLAGDLSGALVRAEQALAEGADVLDIGGESSRPGAEPVSEQQELDRVMPLLERLADGPVPVSIDTVKPVVMRAALAAGASLINDINGFRAEGAVEAVASGNAALCVMHMQGRPRTMQAEPRYDDVVGEVRAFLHARVDVLRSAGVAEARILLDPGFGFGKTIEHNLAMLRDLAAFGARGYPVLAGLSRKSLLGTLTGRPMGERAIASVVAAVIAVQGGARIVRVHDVAATRDALTVWEAVEGGQPSV
ncbi:MAG TPA: dihydropteroate synthase [Rhodocyclaceae bacterium]|nr:dihydropteroate synthase [Rhodocyclaceae bacterium]